MHSITLTSQFSRDRAKICSWCKSEFAKDPRNTWRQFERQQFCSLDCAGRARTAIANANRRPMREEFDRWLSRDGECWEWQGARDRNGYGAFSYAGKTRRAHVVALELDGRKPAKGEYACHRCNNPPCVRPDHLYPGTPTQNMADAIANSTTQRGERQHMAKLTEDAVRIIRRSTASVGDLSRQFGVSHGAVSMVRAGKTWRHVQ